MTPGSPNGMHVERKAVTTKGCKESREASQSRFALISVTIYKDCKKPCLLILQPLMTHT